MGRGFEQIPRNSYVSFFHAAAIVLHDHAGDAARAGIGHALRSFTEKTRKKEKQP